MAKVQHWEVEADYFTYCNCDWGCPCTFNARPTDGTCHGVGAWRITRGKFGSTRLDGAVCAIAYFFPGLIEQGNGRARAYIDRRTTPAQRIALEAIVSGKAGGGIFELFAKLASKWYPTRVVDIDLRIDRTTASLRIPDVMEGESEALRYPDGTVITPILDLPHGIEFKRGTATNAKRWWVRDEDLLAYHENRYGAVAKVRFNENGCVG